MKNLIANHISEAQIYHSPFYAIPPDIQANEAITCFLTVYDLIPILRPDLFSDGEPQAIRQLIDSIDPTMWILCISEATRTDLLEYRRDLDPDKVVATPLAASSAFRPIRDDGILAATRRRYEIPETPYFLSLCTLEPRKNLDFAIRAFRRFLETTGEDVNLVLAGTLGWKYQDIFAELTKDPELKRRVFVTGFVEDDDLPALYSGALAFVYPSLYEGFGLPPLEAMRCRVPVITSNTSSLPEVVGDAGILIDPNDLDGLSHALERVSEDIELREDLGRRALLRSKEFSWERTVFETVSAYRRALSAS